MGDNNKQIPDEIWHDIVQHKHFVALPNSIDYEHQSVLLKHKASERTYRITWEEI